jgi:hypothetical protein
MQWLKTTIHEGNKKIKAGDKPFRHFVAAQAGVLIGLAVPCYLLFHSNYILNCFFTGGCLFAGFSFLCYLRHGVPVPVGKAHFGFIYEDSR